MVVPVLLLWGRAWWEDKVGVERGPAHRLTRVRVEHFTGHSNQLCGTKTATKKVSPLGQKGTKKKEPSRTLVDLPHQSSGAPGCDWLGADGHIWTWYGRPPHLVSLPNGSPPPPPVLNWLLPCGCTSLPIWTPSSKCRHKGHLSSPGVCLSPGKSSRRCRQLRIWSWWIWWRKWKIHLDMDWNPPTWQ